MSKRQRTDSNTSSTVSLPPRIAIAASSNLSLPPRTGNSGVCDPDFQHILCDQVVLVNLQQCIDYVYLVREHDREPISLGTVLFD